VNKDKRLIEALGDITRYQILKLIKDEGPMSVSDIAIKLEKHRATIDKHVKQLMKAGLLIRREDPKRGVYLYILTDTALKVIDTIEKAKGEVPRPIVEMPIKKLKRISIRKIAPIIKKAITYGPSIFFMIIGMIGFIAPIPGVNFIGKVMWLVIMLLIALLWNMLMKRVASLE